MTPDDAARLKELTRALLLAEQQRLADLANTEVEARRALHRLEDLAERNRACARPDPAVRAAGADLLWQGWVSRKRAELQAALAGILARKHAELQKVRHALGRDLAAQRVLDRVVADRQQKRRRRVEAARLADRDRPAG